MAIAPGWVLDQHKKELFESVVPAENHVRVSLRQNRDCVHAPSRSYPGDLAFLAAKVIVVIRPRQRKNLTQNVHTECI